MHLDKLPKFSQTLWLALGVFIIFSLVFVSYVNSEKRINHAHELRLRSFLLADELRQSSDDLTRMVRNYVLTANPLYKRYYQEILDIRDGKQARPLNYQTAYWDWVLNEGQRPCANGAAIALLELMRQAGFTPEEFAKLAEAKANSDKLTAIEYAAMRLIESTESSIDKRFKASLMLSEADYFAAKAAITRPLSEVKQMMAQRTLNAVHQAEQDALRLRMVFIVFGLLLIITLWRLYRALHTTLGGSVDVLYQRIACLGNGDCLSPIPIAKGMEHSIMARLAETQSRLAKLDAERHESKTKNQRLNQLYAVLSQCNQAIVRCATEQELFTHICRDAVCLGGMKMAWIGTLDTQNQCIVPVAAYGNGTEYLAGIHISVDVHHVNGRGPTGTAAREDRPFWCQDFQHELITAPWHERGAKFDWHASAAIPLHKNDVVIGAFTLYSAELNAFDEAARNLLIKMAIDIDYALNNFAQQTQRKQAETALADSYNLLTTIINTAPIRIFWKDKQLRYLGCNPVFAHDAHENSPEDIIGKNDYQLAWKANAKNYRADDSQIIQTGIAKLSYEEPQTTTEGKNIWLRTSKVPLYNERNEIIGVLGVYEDITEQKRSAEHIHYLANFDALTGLPNRVQLTIRANYAINLAKRNNRQLALIFLDLDHFKDINDTFGHSIGDTLLIEFAKRLRLVLREEDTLTRLGGDEFILLLPNINMQGAAQVANKLLDVITLPYRIEHYDMRLTASIGIAIYPNDGTDLESLSKSADTAMYRVKQEGRHSFSFFTQEMQQRTTRNLQVLNALRYALEYQQLQVYYQPQVSFHNNKIIGAEALLRWHHPELGMVSPTEFIAIAEDSGLILPIGEWVLRTAVRQVKAWIMQGFKPLVIAVNLSAVQFRHADLPNLISRILQQENLAAHHLELELTESIAMHNPQDAINIIDKLHQQGIRLSIDDFGTGYSSLSYLKKFKVCKLKIDQSFIRDIDTNSEDKAIVIAIINLAKSLNLKTIAEGVETIGQHAFLYQQGCDQAQGYLFSQALPVDAFEKLLASESCII